MGKLRLVWFNSRRIDQQHLDLDCEFIGNDDIDLRWSEGSRRAAGIPSIKDVIAASVALH